MCLYTSIKKLVIYFFFNSFCKTARKFSELRQAGGFFKNKYVDTLLFLDEFQLKDAHEKQAFFTELKNELDFFPDNIAKNRILPKLIHVCSVLVVEL